MEILFERCGIVNKNPVDPGTHDEDWRQALLVKRGSATRITLHDNAGLEWERAMTIDQHPKSKDGTGAQGNLCGLDPTAGHDRGETPGNDLLGFAHNV